MAPASIFGSLPKAAKASSLPTPAPASIFGVSADTAATEPPTTISVPTSEPRSTTNLDPVSSDSTSHAISSDKINKDSLTSGNDGDDDAASDTSSYISSSPSPSHVGISFSLQDGGRHSFLPARARFLAEQQNTKYTLRQHIDRQNFRGSGWQDRDDTGNYDPTSKYPFDDPKPKPKRQQHSKSEGHLDTGDELGESNLKKKKKLTYNQGRREGRSLVVTLKFHTENALNEFAHICFNNWSDNDVVETRPRSSLGLGDFGKDDALASRPNSVLLFFLGYM